MCSRTDLQFDLHYQEVCWMNGLELNGMALIVGCHNNSVPTDCVSSILQTIPSLPAAYKGLFQCLLTQQTKFSHGCLTKTLVRWLHSQRQAIILPDPPSCPSFPLSEVLFLPLGHVWIPKGFPGLQANWFSIPADSMEDYAHSLQHCGWAYRWIESFRRVIW